ncbi:MAG: hypothetical protein H2172_09030 [Opitutus sp.]|nr:hypothetical protein [Opitutus sp.]MCS6247591.1 hypothetical protein [Opitutus sp.]MCS6274041.1 hypothetical protein [Opitutus sp.]MCS6276498.1 hypothetical protein [Opitutus sp.]MCS6301854.1 hypothetical protein [Opitutus sp.]
MPSAPAKTAPVTRVQGAIAWLLAGLVLTLGLLAASPETHARLHAAFDAPAADGHCGDQPHGASHAASHAGAHDDSDCAVSLFQHGVTAPLPLPRLTCPQRVWSVSQSQPSDRQLPPPAPHRLQPARGPPGLG